MSFWAVRFVRNESMTKTEINITISRPDIISVSGLFKCNRCYFMSFWAVRFARNKSMTWCNFRCFEISLNHCNLQRKGPFFILWPETMWDNNPPTLWPKSGLSFISYPIRQHKLKKNVLIISKIKLVRVFVIGRWRSLYFKLSNFCKFNYRNNLFWKQIMYLLNNWFNKKKLSWS